MSYHDLIHSSGLTIYDPIDSSSPLYIPTQSLEEILNRALVGKSLSGLPLRTRSKVVKAMICEALGYPVPRSFAKTQPRFLGQNSDVYAQKSLNVQIWNEDVDPARRYILPCVDSNDVITKVRVITGDQLSQYDRTGTLTRKYQATMSHYGKSQLFSVADTVSVSKWISSPHRSLHGVNPNSPPRSDELLPIEEIFHRLLPLEGKQLNYIDAVQERNRGAELHSLICKNLGYSIYSDDGTYPDIANQLLEIKLQTSPTIDLGLHSPTDGKCIIETYNVAFYSEDVRYAIFDATVNGSAIMLKHLYMVSGEDFPSYFSLFQGKVQNAKLQIPLPTDFFD